MQPFTRTNVVITGLSLLVGLGTLLLDLPEKLPRFLAQFHSAPGQPTANGQPPLAALPAARSPPTSTSAPLRLSNPRVVADGRGGAAAQALLDLSNPQATSQQFFIGEVTLVLDPNPDGLRFSAAPTGAQYCGSNFTFCRDTLGNVPQTLAPGETRTLTIPVQVAPVLAGRRIETLRPAVVLELMLADARVVLTTP